MLKLLLKKLLPSSLQSLITQWRISFKLFLSAKCSRFKFTSGLYYLFFDQQFYREQQATLAGKIAYSENNGLAEKSSALLRRNIHRLEKGLIMKPRKAVFAQGYITETVNCFSACLHRGGIDEQELKWAQDVLTQYFVIVENTDIISNAKYSFNALPVVDEKGISAIPYTFDERIQANVQANDLHDLFKQRRSVRWFKKQHVDKATIAQAVEMAAQAPSACNRQPFQFYTFTDPEKASKIASIPMGTKGFAQNVPALIVVVGDLSAYPKERDRHVIYIDGGLVAMQLMLAFETLGLSTCPINWPDMEVYERKMDQALNLEKHQRPIMLMAIGYGDDSGGIPFSQKKSTKQLIKDMD
ncbi:nitroreductase family protein [Colwelliaceae bacterium 6471]